MSYAITKNDEDIVTSWRAIESPEDMTEDEIWSEEQPPVVTDPKQPILDQIAELKLQFTDTVIMGCAIGIEEDIQLATNLHSQILALKEQL
jgi:hypothetical protein